MIEQWVKDGAYFVKLTLTMAIHDERWLWKFDEKADADLLVTSIQRRLMGIRDDLYKYAASNLAAHTK